jgi:hypothetical protein
MGTDKEQATIVTKEMGITHKEFYDELPHLLSGIPYHHDKDSIKFQLKDKNIEITLGPEGSRQLGRSVRLPVTLVTIRFSGCSEQQIAAFIKHFNLRFMKGGG